MKKKIIITLESETDDERIILYLKNNLKLWLEDQFWKGKEAEIQIENE